MADLAVHVAELKRITNQLATATTWVSGPRHTVMAELTASLQTVVDELQATPTVEAEEAPEPAAEEEQALPDALEETPPRSRRRKGSSVE